jgi:hypothetical protein
MANESELLLNVVIANKPKMLRGLNQNDKWSGSKVTSSFDADVAPPAKRQSLIHSGTHAERGKPVSLPLRESESQDEPMEMQAWDSRKSECSTVMVEIEVDTSRESVQTSAVVSLGENR